MLALQAAPLIILTQVRWWYRMEENISWNHMYSKMETKLDFLGGFVEKEWYEKYDLYDSAFSLDTLSPVIHLRELQVLLTHDG